MKMMNLSLTTLFFMFFVACSSSGSGSLTPMVSPSDIKVSSRNNLGYISDAQAGSIAVLDLARNKLLDTDPDDDFNSTPIFAGGNLSAIAIDDRGATPRIYTADAEHGYLLAFDIQATVTTPKEYSPYAAVNLGGATVGVATKPIFFNAGRFSSPFIPQIEVSSNVSTEFWKLEFINNETGYRVTGSKSGIQSNMAKEGVAYHNDDSTVSFTIFPGGDPTTQGDVFYFGTASLQPLTITGTPEDLLVDGRFLYVLTNSPAALLVIDMDTLAVTHTVSLTDGSPTAAILGKAALGQGHLYVPNKSNGNYFDVETTGFTFSVVSTGIKCSSITISSDFATLLLNHSSEKKLTFVKVSDHSVLGSVYLSNIPVSTATYALSSKNYAAVSTTSGIVDLIDVDAHQRIDISDGDGIDSNATSIEFYDHGATSTPDIISIATIDAVTASERWQMVYEGTIPGATDISTTVSGDQVTVSGASLDDLKVGVGDKVTLTSGSSTAEATILQILSDTQAQLSSTPAIQGAAKAEIRANQSYVLFGTLSGTQKNRVIENQTYASDDQSVTFKVRSSLFSPTTSGDFFTFITLDGVNSIATNATAVSGRIIALVPPNVTTVKAYVLHELPSSISLIDLQNHSLDTNIK